MSCHFPGVDNWVRSRILKLASCFLTKRKQGGNTNLSIRTGEAHGSLQKASAIFDNKAAASAAQVATVFILRVR